MPDKQQSARDRIRSATLGKSNKLQSRTVTANGEQIELRQPTVKVRNELLQAAKTPDGDVDFNDFLLRGVIQCAYVPGTKERIYEDEDYDVLAEQPTNSFVDDCSEELMSLLNVTPGDVEKNSAGTGSGNSSST